MAKDAKGHGSDTGTKGMRLIKTHTNGPHSAKVYNNPEWGEKVVKFFHNGQYQSKADSHTDDIADAHGTAQSQLSRWADQDAASALASGTSKSAAAPTSHGMTRISTDRDVGYTIHDVGPGGKKTLSESGTFKGGEKMRKINTRRIGTF